MTLRLKSILLVLILTLAAPGCRKKNAAVFGHDVGIQWVSIPGGTFSMGSGKGPEGPVHNVTIKSFLLAKTMVTNKQYRACIAAGACTKPIHFGSQFDGDDQPVVGVNWSQAEAFAQWIGGILPSEAQWEYAARGAGKEQRYPWGDEEATCDRAVILNCGAATAPVCSKPAGNTKQGLCDMAGNAWEWLQDQYHNSYAGAPTDGSAWEEPGSSRVVRGGSWLDDAGYVRSAFRDDVVAGNRGIFYGFRLARSQPDPAAH